MTIKKNNKDFPEFDIEDISHYLANPKTNELISKLTNQLYKSRYTIFPKGQLIEACSGDPRTTEGDGTEWVFGNPKKEKCALVEEEGYLDLGIGQKEARLLIDYCLKIGVLIAVENRLSNNPKKQITFFFH
jgi:hypothetical protein